MTTAATHVEATGQQALLPWAAWYGDTLHALHLPMGWTVRDLSPPPQPELSETQVFMALYESIAAPRLGDLARRKRSAVIVVDDLSRPTPAAQLAPLLFSRIVAAGVRPDRITVLVAAGAHGPVPEAKLRDKLGAQIISALRVECHDPHGTLTDTGVPYGAESLKINATFAAADLKVTVGCVMPHPFAGYSGGAKMVLPGLTDLAAAERAHKFVQLGLRGGMDPEKNRFRLEAETVAQRLGLQFAVCAVTGPKRELIALHAGDVVAAHRLAAASARAAGHTPLNGPYDALVLGAYPKDVNLVQSAAALVALRRLNASPLTPHGVMILATAASEGVGRHDLFGPQGVSYHAPAPLRQLVGRPLWIYAPNLTSDEVHRLYASEYPHFRCPHELCAALAQRFGPVATVGIVPTAARQELSDA